jgi:hypothetical protein
MLLMRKVAFVFAVVLSSSFVLFGCDRFIVVKGTVMGSLLTPQQPLVSGSVSDHESTPLPDVRVALYHSPTSTERVGVRSGRSNAQGEYRIFAPRPPFGSPTKDLFLEFSRSGYKTKQVSLADQPADSTVEIKPCTKKEESFACWEVNVVLISDTTP